MLPEIYECRLCGHVLSCSNCSFISEEINEASIRLESADAYAKELHQTECKLAFAEGALGTTEALLKSYKEDMLSARKMVQYFVDNIPNHIHTYLPYVVKEVERWKIEAEEDQAIVDVNFD